MRYINPYMLFTGSMIPNWLMRRNEISAGAKLTYARLCQYAGQNGKAWPSQQTMAEELGLKSVDQIGRYMKELSDNNLVIRERRGLGLTDVYRFLHHEWMEANSADVRVTDSADMRIQDSADMPTKENQGRESLKPKKETRQSRLSDEWEPNQSDFNWANDKHPSVDTIHETTKFKNYHIAKGSLMANWSRAWMTWITNAEEFNAKRNRPSPAAASKRPVFDRDESMQRILAAADNFSRNKHG